MKFKLSLIAALSLLTCRATHCDVFSKLATSARVAFSQPPTFSFKSFAPKATLCAGALSTYRFFKPAVVRAEDKLLSAEEGKLIGQRLSDIKYVMREKARIEALAALGGGRPVNALNVLKFLESAYCDGVYGYECAKQAPTRKDIQLLKDDFEAWRADYYERNGLPDLSNKTWLQAQHNHISREYFHLSKEMGMLYKDFKSCEGLPTEIRINTELLDDFYQQLSKNGGFDLDGYKPRSSYEICSDKTFKYLKMFAGISTKLEDPEKLELYKAGRVATK